MKLLLALLLFSQAGAVDCVSELRSRGYGAAAAAAVVVYSDCINSKLGAEAEIRSACLDARAKAARQARSDNKVTTALRWLDAMIHWRTQCETYLKVEA